MQSCGPPEIEVETKDLKHQVCLTADPLSGRDAAHVPQLLTAGCVQT